MSWSLAHVSNFLQEPSKDEGDSGAEGLSSKLFNEMRSRLQGDLQYLWVTWATWALGFL